MMLGGIEIVLGYLSVAEESAFERSLKDVPGEVSASLRKERQERKEREAKERREEEFAHRRHQERMDEARVIARAIDRSGWF